MAVIGPGAQQDQVTDTPSLLAGASEYEYVTIKNILSDDFAIRVAQDIPVNLPFNIGKDPSGKTTQLTNTEQDARQIYGLGLKNPDFQARKHIVNDMVIKAGQQINLKGNEAQVAVRQLVNEILQQEGKQRLMSDPVLRREVEERIVIRRGSVQDLMDRNIQTLRDQTDAAIAQSNRMLKQTQPVTTTTPVSAVKSEVTSNAAPARSPGRPRKQG